MRWIKSSAFFNNKRLFFVYTLEKKHERLKFMKKIFAITLSVLLMLSMCIMLSACGNMSLGMGNFDFEKIHVDTYHYSGCFTVEKWYDNGTGIEVKTKEAGALFLSEGQYILIEDDCPFCAANKIINKDELVDIEDINRNEN